MRARTAASLAAASERAQDIGFTLEEVRELLRLERTPDCRDARLTPYLATDNIIAQACTSPRPRVHRSPLALVSMGIGGAWIAQLRALERFQWVFLALALAAFGFAFYRLYLRPVSCAPGTACATPATRRRQRIAFWVTLISAKALILAPVVYTYVAA